MQIVIKKRVDLDFLGDEYKKAYLIFRSFSIPEYGDLRRSLNNLKDEDAGDWLIKTLEGRFLTGEFPDENGKLQKVETEDLKQFDFDTIAQVYRRFTGETPDPKA